MQAHYVRRKVHCGPGLEQRQQRQNHQILVVDDSSFSRRHLASILQNAGYRVKTQNNGNLALGHLEKSSLRAYAAVVSDVEMPEMDGMEFARQIRASQRWGSIPLFALSGRSTPADVQFGMTAGFTQYFSKLQTDELLSAIDRHLGIGVEEVQKHVA